MLQTSALNQIKLFGCQCEFLEKSFANMVINIIFLILIIKLVLIVIVKINYRQLLKSAFSLI
jgi:hypothetical protein